MQIKIYIEEIGTLVFVYCHAVCKSYRKLFPGNTFVDWFFIADFRASEVYYSFLKKLSLNNQ
mgnify:CR=1 FL=1